MIIDTQTDPTLGRLHESHVVALAAHTHHLLIGSMTSIKKIMATEAMSSMMTDTVRTMVHRLKI